VTAYRNPLLGLACAALAALVLEACAQTVSTASFKGEAHTVAQTLANLQSDVTAGNDQKICADDLASAVVKRLDASRGGCKQAIKGQLDEVDSLELTVHSVLVHAATGASSSSAHPTASAIVTSVYAGKTKAGTVALVKEGGKWKISGVN
jgi:hypothetical protein